jgi:hypothetical protein
MTLVVRVSLRSSCQIWSLVYSRQEFLTFIKGKHTHDVGFSKTALRMASYASSSASWGTMSPDMLKTQGQAYTGVGIRLL